MVMAMAEGRWRSGAIAQLLALREHRGALLLLV